MLDPDATELDYRLLKRTPRDFLPRQRLGRFLVENLGLIRDRSDCMVAESWRGEVQPLFVYWDSGFSAAPDVVRFCHSELTRLHSRGGVVSLDDSLVGALAQVPPTVATRARSAPNKYADILRLDLLSRHGGIWVDATCLAVADLRHIVPDLLPSGFFAFRREDDRVCNWFLACSPANRVVSMMREALSRFWETHTAARQYFVFHDIFEILTHLDPDFGAIWNNAPRITARDPHMLQHAMHEPHDSERLGRLLRVCFVHKLTHKYPLAVLESDSNLDQLIRHGVRAVDHPTAESQSVARGGS